MIKPKKFKDQDNSTIKKYKDNIELLIQIKNMNLTKFTEIQQGNNSNFYIIADFYVVTIYFFLSPITDFNFTPNKGWMPQS